MNRLLHLFNSLFPERVIFTQTPALRRQIIIFLVLGVVFYGVGCLIPANGFIAFDWVHVFSKGQVPPFYPPWGELVARFLTWPLLVSLSLSAISLSILKRSIHPVSAVMALLSLPVFWTMFLGQWEGLVVLGLLGLPWLTPLALLKPQVSFFAFAAKKSYLLAFAIWFVISLLVWGLWPLRMFAVSSYYAEGRYVQDIAIGLVGAVFAVPMLWYSRGDMDMLMISGAFITPHLIPYNMLPFAPAIARLRPLPATLACLLSWLPFSANWLGPRGWWLGWLFAACLWIGLAVQRRANSKSGQMCGK